MSYKVEIYLQGCGSGAGKRRTSQNPPSTPPRGLPAGGIPLATRQIRYRFQTDPLSGFLTSPQLLFDYYLPIELSFDIVRPRS
jgi:hypothetical protein